MKKKNVKKKKIKIKADIIARFVINDIGSHYSVSHVPDNRYGATALTERQIEDYITQYLQKNIPNYDPSKWNPKDRIRYFGYKKQRIITLIEVPRIEELKKEMLNDNNKSGGASGGGGGGSRSSSNAKSPFLNANSGGSAGSGGVSPRTRGGGIASEPISPQDLSMTDLSKCEVIALIRDAHGKYCWELSSQYETDESKTNNKDLETVVEESNVARSDSQVLCQF